MSPHRILTEEPAHINIMISSRLLEKPVTPPSSRALSRVSPHAYKTARSCHANVLLAPVRVATVPPSHLRVPTPPLRGTRAVPPKAPVPTAPFRCNLFLRVLGLSNPWVDVLGLSSRQVILGGSLEPPRVLLCKGWKASEECQRPQHHK